MNIEIAGYRACCPADDSSCSFYIGRSTGRRPSPGSALLFFGGASWGPSPAHAGIIGKLCFYYTSYIWAFSRLWATVGGGIDSGFGAFQRTRRNSWSERFSVIDL